MKNRSNADSVPNNAIWDYRSLPCGCWIERDKDDETAVRGYVCNRAVGLHAKLTLRHPLQNEPSSITEDERAALWAALLDHYKEPGERHADL